jgi:antitoxin ParD1/3/4
MCSPPKASDRKTIERGGMPQKAHMKSQGQEGETRLAALEAAIARGIAHAEEGHVKLLATVFDRLEAKYRSAVTRSDKHSQIKTADNNPSS